MLYIFAIFVLIPTYSVVGVEKDPDNVHQNIAHSSCRFKTTFLHSQKIILFSILRRTILYTQLSSFTLFGLSLIHFNLSGFLNISSVFTGVWLNFLIGCLFLAIAIRLIVVPMYDFVLSERLKMTRGLPPYLMWETPAPEVRLSLYIFTVENSEQFLNGTDSRLRFKEIGPIVYREHLFHRDVVFHENSTLSYTAHRHLEFLEQENEPGILNRTILVPNFIIFVSLLKFCIIKSILQEEDNIILGYSRIS